ncbi:hypothetical protein CEXT_265471 [Caerostris extrusa]|uniref:Uncharacterized protein n=1 Tax=Caerostris extrusa TaxID=172846 RepID=A0AAV4XRA2_CAEEX|nr:hypothetical protein CEXT_265471 [Caerostris extrusa]
MEVSSRDETTCPNEWGWYLTNRTFNAFSSRPFTLSIQLRDSYVKVIREYISLSKFKAKSHLNHNYPTKARNVRPSPFAVAKCYYKVMYSTL